MSEAGWSAPHDHTTDAHSNHSSMTPEDLAALEGVAASINGGLLGSHEEERPTPATLAPTPTTSDGQQQQQGPAAAASPSRRAEGALTPLRRRQQQPARESRCVHVHSLSPRVTMSILAELMLQIGPLRGEGVTMPEDWEAQQQAATDAELQRLLSSAAADRLLSAAASSPTTTGGSSGGSPSRAASRAGGDGSSFAVVEFEDVESVEYCVKVLDGLPLFGTPISVRSVRPAAEGADLCLRNCPLEFTTQAVRRLVEAVAPAPSVRLMGDEQPDGTVASHGLAFASLCSLGEAAAAIVALNGCVACGAPTFHESTTSHSSDLSAAQSLTVQFQPLIGGQATHAGPVPPVSEGRGVCVACRADAGG